MSAGHPIDQASFTAAQKAELSNWQGLATNSEHIRHELYEHSEIASPLHHVIKDQTFESGLEVGIGVYSLGFLAVHLRDQVKHIDGIDPLPRLDLRLQDEELQERVDEIRSQVTYTQSPAENMPLPNNAYDIVSCVNVVDHAQDPAKILQEIDRVMKPGGLLIFGVSTLSAAGELKWKIHRSFQPDNWLFVAHPHTFQWAGADSLVRGVGGKTLWQDRPPLTQRLVGHGRMSFWIRQKGTQPK